MIDISQKYDKCKEYETIIKEMLEKKRNGITLTEIMAGMSDDTDRGIVKFVLSYYSSDDIESKKIMRIVEKEIKRRTKEEMAKELKEVKKIVKKKLKRKAREIVVGYFLRKYLK